MHEGSAQDALRSVRGRYHITKVGSNVVYTSPTSGVHGSNYNVEFFLSDPL